MQSIESLLDLEVESEQLDVGQRRLQGKVAKAEPPKLALHLLQILAGGATARVGEHRVGPRQEAERACREELDLPDIHRRDYGLRAGGAPLLSDEPRCLRRGTGRAKVKFDPVGCFQLGGAGDGRGLRSGLTSVTSRLRSGRLDVIGPAGVADAPVGPPTPPYAESMC